jgi:hypothetical protein
MIELPNIKFEIDSLSNISNEIDLLDDEIYLSKDIKQSFGNIWGKGFVVKTDLIKLKTSTSEGASKSIHVVDSLLIKCAFAVSLYTAYDEYVKYLNEVKREAALTASEVKPFGEEKRNPIPNAVVEKVELAINSRRDLSDESKEKLKIFILADKGIRENEFGCYKGLSRTDPFQPVAATTLGLRIDYSGFIDEIIKCLYGNDTVRNQIKNAFLKFKKYHSASESEMKELYPNLPIGFKTALTECGFITSKK